MRHHPADSPTYLRTLPDSVIAVNDVPTQRRRAFEFAEGDNLKINDASTWLLKASPSQRDVHDTQDNDDNAGISEDTALRTDSECERFSSGQCVDIGWLFLLFLLLMLMLSLLDIAMCVLVCSVCLWLMGNS